MPQLDVILVPKGPALAFPGTELVAASAALFHNRTRWDGSEGRTFSLVVSPGTVGCAMADPARGERNALNGLGHDTRGTRQVLAPPVAQWEGDDEVYYVRTSDEPDWREPRPARQVEGWSRKSRARMVRTLAQLDWSPMYADDRPAVMVTLTYPGDWLAVARSGRDVKRHLERFYKAWGRRWGGNFVGPWKLEFQRRGAPHVHLMTVPPADPLFREWLSKTWAACVAHPDPEQYRMHLLAGTGVDYLRGGRCFDPKRAAVYFSKHGGAAGGKEYQHTVPVEWQESGSGPGRFWGYKGLSKAVESVAVPLEDYVQVRRTLRRLSRSQGLTRTVRVPRGASSTTGEVRYRTVTRPLSRIAQGGLSGGTLVVNDGPALMSSLARLPLLQRETLPSPRARGNHRVEQVSADRG